MIKDLTTENFDEVNNTNIAVVDFFANWCGPCKVLKPVIQDISDTNEDVLVGMVDVDENYEIAVKYHIRSIPTILFFKGGEMVEKIAGVISRNELQDKITKLK